jgi:hypothetical protein
MVENEELLEIGGVSQAPYSVTSGHGMTSGTTVEMCGASARSVAVDRQYWRGVGPTNGLAWISTDESLPKTTRRRSGHCTS